MNFERIRSHRVDAKNDSPRPSIRIGSNSISAPSCQLRSDNNQNPITARKLALWRGRRAPSPPHPLYPTFPGIRRVDVRASSSDRHGRPAAFLAKPRSLSPRRTGRMRRSESVFTSIWTHERRSADRKWTVLVGKKNVKTHGKKARVHSHLRLGELCLNARRSQAWAFGLRPAP